MTLQTSPPLRLDDRAIVGRLRLRSTGPVDPSSTRIRLEAALDEVDLGASGLPPTALLCIRSVRDPLPGELSLDWTARLPSAWKQAFTGQIQRAARYAARPIEGSVPSSAEAVLFRDRGELLACLALDWLNGEVGARWWWRHLVRANATVRIAPAQWLADAPYVPAAARALAERDALVAFAAALEREEAQLLVESLYEAFGLETVTPPRASAPSTEPWCPWVPEVRDPRVALNGARAFVAVSLGLARAPNMTRRPELRAIVQGWLEERLPPQGETEGDARRDGENTAARADGGSPGTTPLSPHGPPRAEPPSARRMAPPNVDQSPYDDAPAVQSHDAHPATEMVRSPGREETELESQDVRLREPAREPVVAPLPRPTVSGVAISTAHGGVFFLLNVFLALELYGDFTRPRSRSVEASPWTLLSRLARALLGTRAEPDDALWSILRDLAGAPGDIDDWPAQFRVHPEWLRPFPDRSGWTWITTTERFCLVHPHRFVVVSAPVEADLPAQRARESAGYGVTDATEATTGVIPTAWPELLSLFVRARLHAALGAEDPDASILMALGARARVRVTDAHVDVHMALADLPIAVRLAGLDRDPGWVPAAGRFVAFHFE